MVQPIFSSHHSVGESILTLETDIYKKINELQPNGTYLPKKTKEIEFKEPISIFAVAKKYELDKVVLVDSDISPYWKFYKGCKELGLQAIFGIKIRVINGEEAHTDSNVIIFLKNSQAYFDVIPLYSYASTNFGHTRYLTWADLKRFWSKNFVLGIPFYSSFVARNIMKFEHAAMPDFEGMEPTFFIENHGLPFDDLIEESTRNWCEINKCKTQETHQIYYFKDKDVMKHQTIRCLRKIPRTNWEKPNLEHYASNEFSFESFLRKNGGKL